MMRGAGEIIVPDRTHVGRRGGQDRLGIQHGAAAKGLGQIFHHAQVGQPDGVATARGTVVAVQMPDDFGQDKPQVADKPSA